MKKALICVTALAAAATASATSYAATYDAANQTVSATVPENKKTVVIMQGDETTLPTEANESKIVYMDEAETAFSSSVNFLIKENPAEGQYTIMLGGDGAIEYQTFYVGMNSAAGDEPLEAAVNEKVIGADGKETYNVGYTGAVPLKTYKSVIIKTQKGDYMGFDVDMTSLEGSGTANVGIQINGVESVTGDNAIANVWLSTRTINKADASTSAN